MPTKSERKQARLFFEELRTRIYSLDQTEPYVYRRYSVPLLIEVASKYKLSKTLCQFIELGLVGHGLNPDTNTYKQSRLYKETLKKWNVCFHVETCVECGSKMPFNTYTHPLKPIHTKFCSPKCRNNSAEVRKKNSDGLKAMFANPVLKAKWIKKQQRTSLRLHGTLHQNQTEAARERIRINAFTTGYMKFKLKNHSYEGYTWEGLQGYEPQAIDWLIQHKNKLPSTIVAGSSVPKFYYIYNGKRRLYYPDLLLENQTFIEVKSSYTLNINRELIKAKLRAVVDAGYQIALMVISGTDGNLKLGRVWRPKATPRKIKPESQLITF